MSKKDFLLKLKDYNNELEKVLEKKDFSENVKNLLLSMLYKIETSYSDYEKTKVNVKTKVDYVEEIISLIDKNCETIEITKEKKTVIEKKNKKIIVYQNEIELLNAIYKISENNIKIQHKYDLFSAEINEFLHIGNIKDNLEVINDFDGWTWFRDKSNLENLHYNLVYQNMLILTNTRFINQWINNKEYVIDYINNLYSLLERKYGRENAIELIYLMFLIVVQEYLKSNEEEKERLKEIKKQIKEKLRICYNKSKFLEELSKENKENIKIINNIDSTLGDVDLLNKEFIKRNRRGEELFSINSLKKILNKEKDNASKKIKENNKLMNPKKFVENQKLLKDRFEFLDEIENSELEDNILKFQKVFIDSLILEIEKETSKKKIEEFIYIVRYYKFINIEKESCIKDIKKLQGNINELENKLIIKILKNKIVNKITENTEINYIIIKEILNLKIIDLENIEIQIEKAENGYCIKFYDDESLEKEKIIKTETKLKELGIKIERKIKIFS